MLTIITIGLIFYIFILKKKIGKNKLEYIYQREIPTQDSPAYVGKIIKGHTDGNDVISTILDLEIKGYINISKNSINGKEKTILTCTGKSKNIELEEHEMFLLNQLFKDDSEIVFEDYISSDKLKNDFKVFDKMLERKIERKSIKNESLIKKINKIIFFSLFILLGISIFYAIFQPIIIFTIKDTTISIIINIIISAVIYIGIAYVYISYINKKSLINNIIAIKITYIICFIILCLLVTTFNFENLLKILQNEIVWYKIIISFITAIITLLYMFNIIDNKDEKSYFFYFITGIALLNILINCKIAISINIILLSIYSFMIIPKEFNLKKDDYIYKWMSFKRFIEDYSLLADQDENALLIWEKYLIYAISLGVNKKIIKRYSQLSHVNLFNENYYKKFYKEYID